MVTDVIMNSPGYLFSLLAPVAAPSSDTPQNPGIAATVPWVRLGLILIAAQCLALGLLGVMLLNKHHHLLIDLTLSRIEVMAAGVESTLQTGQRTGLQADEMTGLGTTLTAIRRAEDGLAAIAVFVVDNASARVVHADEASRIGTTLPAPEWQSLQKSRGFVHGSDAQGPWLGAVIRDAADEVTAGLIAYAAPAPLDAQAATMAATLWPRIGIAMLVAILATISILAWLRRRPLTQIVLRRTVMTASLLLTVVAGASVAWNAQAMFATALAPAIEAKVERAADFLAGKIVRATELGIPLEKLPGVADAFATFMLRNPEVAALRLTDSSDYALAERISDTRQGHKVQRAIGAHGQIEAVADAGFIARRLSELSADVAVVLLVAILIFREMLGALLGTLTGPGHAVPSTAERLQALRLPLFLLILTEEMSRAFLPLYIKSFATGSTGLNPETEVGLPIAAYMLCFALATPFAGRWADRWGVNRVFAAGVGLTLAGFAWTALAVDYWQLLPARALCAWGYATGTMACQRQLILLSGPGNRARGLALFVGAVGIAAICGTALGGVLADQFGFRPVFGISALLALLAWASFRLSAKTRRTGRGRPDEAGPELNLAEVIRLLRTPRFSLLMLGAAIPAKIVLAGFLFYLAPLALHQENYGPAAIGRALMLYFVLVAAINPIASHLSDRYGWRLSLTIIGGILIGAGGFAGLVGGETALWLGIAALGVGTGLATAPMQALATEIGAAAGATSVAVVLRTLERLGSVIGPLWAGLWLASTGWPGAMVAIGAVMLAGTLLCIPIREARRP
jgi:predicted MFS family arabinose efflux permease